MTAQVTDPFYWNDKEYVFSGAEDVYSLFDPEKYGLHPEMSSTACYKGFIITFSVRDDQLYIDELEVYCPDDNYPPINGVEATDDGCMCPYVYRDLNIASNYTGIITISHSMKEEYEGRAFTGPHSYRTNYELKFREGKLVDYKETSGTYFGF